MANRGRWVALVLCALLPGCSWIRRNPVKVMVTPMVVGLGGGILLARSETGTPAGCDEPLAPGMVRDAFCSSGFRQYTYGALFMFVGIALGVGSFLIAQRIEPSYYSDRRDSSPGYSGGGSDETGGGGGGGSGEGGVGEGESDDSARSACEHAYEQCRASERTCQGFCDESRVLCHASCNAEWNSCEDTAFTIKCARGKEACFNGCLLLASVCSEGCVRKREDGMFVTNCKSCEGKVAIP